MRLVLEQRVDFLFHKREAICTPKGKKESLVKQDRLPEARQTGHNRQILIGTDFSGWRVNYKGVNPFI